MNFIQESALELHDRDTRKGLRAGVNREDGFVSNRNGMLYISGAKRLAQNNLAIFYDRNLNAGNPPLAHLALG